MKRLFFVATVFGVASVLTGCASPPRKPALHADDYADTVRIACVGDSITYGSGVENREANNYPMVLGKLLGPRFAVRNFGVGGATLLKEGDKPYWGLAEFQAISEFEPDAVILKLGTNDSKPQNWRHGDAFERDLRHLLRHFASLRSHPRIWVCLPVPVYETRWGINEATVSGHIIPVIRQVAGEMGLPTIDLHQAMSDRPEYFPDKIHPNAAGAAMIAMTIFTALKGR
ncbi:MAG TPA: GDSL-type esterase/lipase family protein [Verrucomicrobiae bacterium]|nr:GDSL-type esterase/lipase family protein [Verrucomicrobiae bacterium]